MVKDIRTVCLDNIFVLPAYRRRGIAAKLFTEVETWAKEQGAVRLDVYTWDFNNTGGNTAYLEPAICSAITGRLGMFEDRVARLLYKLAVENDMTIGIMADHFRLDEDYLRRRRADSVLNVKRTNGQLSFEQLARQREEDDAWSD